MISTHTPAALIHPARRVIETCAVASRPLHNLYPALSPAGAGNIRTNPARTVARVRVVGMCRDKRGNGRESRCALLGGPVGPLGARVAHERCGHLRVCGPRRVVIFSAYQKAVVGGMVPVQKQRTESLGRRRNDRLGQSHLRQGEQKWLLYRCSPVSHRPTNRGGCWKMGRRNRIP